MLIILIVSFQQSKLTSDKGFKGCYRFAEKLYFLKYLLLDYWMIRVMELIIIIKVISFDHIHKELNSKDDILSKMGVGLQVCEQNYEEYMQGEVLVN